MQWTHTLLWTKKVSKHKAPVAARCALMVAMAIYKLKCNQTKVKTVQLNLSTILTVPLLTASFSIS